MRIGPFELSANISAVFGNLPAGTRFGAAREAGFETVECWWPFDGPTPEPSETMAFMESIAAAGVRLHGLNTYAGNLAAGERGVGCDRDRHGELARSLPILLQIAEATGCRLFNCPFGIVRPGADVDDQRSAAIDALAMVAEAIMPIGGVVLLEPLTTALNPGYPITNCADALEVINRAMAVRGISNIAIQFDVFHLTMNGMSLADELRSVEHIGNVQLADAPTRAEPGTGRVDFRGFLDGLAESSYSGVVACEYFPQDALAPTFDWLSRL